MTERIPDYVELKLRIEPGPAGYRTLAIGPDGSSATGAFSVPFSDVELDNFVLRVGLPRRNARAYRSTQMEEAKRFGATLFDALIKDEVRDVYLNAQLHARANGHGLRLTFQLTGVPELMQIPWEFIYDRPSFLAQSIFTPVVRSLDLTSVRPARDVALPLRILGMVSHPWDSGELDVEREQRNLDRALGSLVDAGLVEIDWLGRATLADLERRLAQPGQIHVLHYIGHGAYDERTQGGVLALEDSNGRTEEVTGEELGSLLADEHSLRLVVLNACEGARTSHVDPFSGVASSLVERGIPAVVGMQFEITDRAAITFAERLFGTLAQSFPVDAAIAQARKAIFAAGSDVEFGTPVLFLRGDARLFDFGDAEVPPDIARLADPPVATEAPDARPVVTATVPPAIAAPATAPPVPAPMATAPSLPVLAEGGRNPDLPYSQAERWGGWIGWWLGFLPGRWLGRTIGSWLSEEHTVVRRPGWRSYPWWVLAIVSAPLALMSEEDAEPTTAEEILSLVFIVAAGILIARGVRAFRARRRRRTGV